VQQLHASALPRLMATGVSAGGLGNSSATPTMMIPDKLIVQHGMAPDFEEDD